jgi:hypothetical protein
VIGGGGRKKRGGATPHGGHLLGIIELVIKGQTEVLKTDKG